VNFIDTAGVYGDGRSERLIGRLKQHRKEKIFIATKAGRRLPKQTVEGYSRKNITSWVEGSLQNLTTDSLDLLQLHCPPTALYNHAEVFGILDDLVQQGRIRFYGVSVAIPVGKRAEQVQDNSQASDLPPLTDDAMTAVRRIYGQRILSLATTHVR
jgi:aryl-alcohol dehydrogenase-like predicted oxidoreductase